jgi:hypothetical protein
MASIWLGYLFRSSSSPPIGFASHDRKLGPARKFS